MGVLPCRSMKDILHSPTITDGVHICDRCETELPAEAFLAACAAGTGMCVDIAGLGTAFVPAGLDDVEALRLCRKGAEAVPVSVLIECEECDGQGNCEACNGAGVILMRGHGDTWEVADNHLDVHLARTEKDAGDLVEFGDLDDTQKMVARMAWNSFLAMRDMTRPAEAGNYS